MSKNAKDTSKSKAVRSTRKVGRPRTYTCKTLEAKFDEYAAWAKESPLYINKVSAGEIVKVSTERPLTLVGFCVFAGIVENTFREYEKLDEFSRVTARVRTAFANSQIEGALIGAYNPNIVARLLGLTDRQDVTTNGKDIQTVAAPVSIVLDAEAADIIQSIGKTTYKR